MSASIPSHPRLPQEIRKFVEAAGRGDNAPILKFLDKYGNSAVDAKDEVGRTALMWAAAAGYKGTMALLLDWGAAPDEQDYEDGRTALMWAALNGRDDAAELLLERGASLDKKDRQLRTAQMLASINSHPQTSEFLKQWPLKQEQRRLDVLAEQHQRWLDETDCSKGLRQPMRAPRPIKAPRP